MRKFIVLIIILYGNYTAFAQMGQLQKLEQELVFLRNTIEKLAFYEQAYYNTNYNDQDNFKYSETIGLLYEQFSRILNKMLIEDSDMTYKYTELQNSGVVVISSKDSLLRVFSWILPGGTQHNYGRTIQYKNTKLAVSSFSFAIDFDNYFESASYDSYEYDTIYALKTNEKSIYILSGNTNLSTKILAYQLIAFSIKKEELIIEPVFENTNKNVSNEVNISYDISCSYDNQPKDGSFPRPTINEKKNMLYLPEVKNECFTGRYTIYKYNGTLFKHTK